MDAASYVLQLLEQRYVRTQAPVPDMPTVGSRWRSASGLDADAIEDRRQSGPKTDSSHRRSSRREARRQRRKALTTQIVSIVIVLALVAGLVYAFIAYRFPHHVVTHSPISSRPAAPLTRMKPNATKPQADAVKPQADATKSEANAATPKSNTPTPKPEADTTKPQADAVKPQADHR